MITGGGRVVTSTNGFVVGFSIGDAVVGGRLVGDVKPGELVEEILVASVVVVVCTEVSPPSIVNTVDSVVIQFSVVNTSSSVIESGFSIGDSVTAKVVVVVCTVVPWVNVSSSVDVVTINGGGGGGPGIIMIRFANCEIKGGIGGCGGGGNLVTVGSIGLFVASLLGFLPGVLLNRGIGGIIGGGGGKFSFSFIIVGKKFDLMTLPINWNTKDFSSAIENLTNLLLTRK